MVFFFLQIHVSTTFIIGSCGELIKTRTRKGQQDLTRHVLITLRRGVTNVDG